jgi:hypothetical protein
LQKPLRALADLLIGEISTPLEGFLAAIHGLDEAGFFFEVTRQNVLQ